MQATTRTEPSNPLLLSGLEKEIRYYTCSKMLEPRTIDELLAVMYDPLDLAIFL